MNDFETLKNTFDKIGQKYELNHYKMIPRLIHNNISIHFDSIIKVDHGAGNKGLTCFYYFLSGKLVGNAIWE